LFEKVAASVIRAFIDHRSAAVKEKMPMSSTILISWHFFMKHGVMLLTPCKEDHALEGAVVLPRRSTIVTALQKGF
jgi:hypothetical protein